MSYSPADLAELRSSLSEEEFTSYVAAFARERGIPGRFNNEELGKFVTYLREALAREDSAPLEEAGPPSSSEQGDTDQTTSESEEDQPARVREDLQPESENQTVGQGTEVPPS